MTTNAPSQGTQFDIALGNHALRATCRLVTNLLADN